MGTSNIAPIAPITPVILFKWVITIMGWVITIMGITIQITAICTIAAHDPYHGLLL
jgi:hypothetical protein